MMKNGARVVCLVLLLVVLRAPGARADSFSLNRCDATLCSGGVTGPFGTVTTSLSAGVITVSVSMNIGYGLFGSTGAFGFDVVDPDAGVTISNVSAGFSVGGTHQAMGGFATFEYLINGPSTAAGAISSLSFKVNRTGGFTSASQL